MKIDLLLINFAKADSELSQKQNKLSRIGQTPGFLPKTWNFAKSGQTAYKAKECS